MSKIRINELARQLEVPSHEILDMLPELGVTEKKTHSSSIDESTAVLVRQRLLGNGASSPQAELAVEPVAPPPAPEAHVTPSPAPKVADESATAPSVAAPPSAPPSVAGPAELGDQPSGPAAASAEEPLR